MLDSLSYGFDAVVPWLAALGSMFGGAAMLIYTIRRARRATAYADATVVEVETLKGEEGTTYRSIFTFSVDGIEHRVTDAFGEWPQQHDVGDRIPVFFPPGKPEEAQSGRSRYIWGPLWVMIAGMIGTAFLSWRYFR